MTNKYSKEIKDICDYMENSLIREAYWETGTKYYVALIEVKIKLHKLLELMESEKENKKEGPTEI